MKARPEARATRGILSKRRVLAISSDLDQLRRIVAALEREGIRALNPPAGFPIEAAQRHFATKQDLINALALVGFRYFAFASRAAFNNSVALRRTL